MRLLCLAVAFAACAPTTNFQKTGEPPQGFRTRPAADVLLYFGVTPSQPHVIVGTFDRAPSDYMNDSLFDLTQDFRRSAAHQGCDAVIVPTGAQIAVLTKEAKDVARASCVMFLTNGGTAAASSMPVAVPAAMPAPSPASAPAAQ